MIELGAGWPVVSAQPDTQVITLTPATSAAVDGLIDGMTTPTPSEGPDVPVASPDTPQE